MKWLEPARDLFAKPSESSPLRLAAWVMLTGLAAAFMAQLFGTGRWPFLAAIVLLGCAGRIATPGRNRDRDFVFGVSGVAIAFLVIFIVVGLILTFEKSLGFLEPSRPPIPSSPLMPSWFKVVMLGTWCLCAAFEVWRFFVRRSRHAA